MTGIMPEWIGMYVHDNNDKDNNNNNNNNDNNNGNGNNRNTYSTCINNCLL